MTTLPPASIWLQYTIIGIIVLVLTVFFTGLFGLMRWLWKAYKTERNEDREWREKQNDKREKAVAEQNQLWREAMCERDERWEKADKEKQQALANIASGTSTLIETLRLHDDRAAAIGAQVDEIHTQVTRPFPKPTKKGNGL